MTVYNHSPRCSICFSRALVLSDTTLQLAWLDVDGPDVDRGREGTHLVVLSEEDVDVGHELYIDWPLEVRIYPLQADWVEVGGLFAFFIFIVFLLPRSF